MSPTAVRALAASPAGERRALEGAADGVHARVRAVIAELRLSGRLLDAPCGSGILGHALEDLGFEVHGVDLEAHPQQQLPADRVQLGDLDQGVPFPDGRFDLVVSVEGIEHLEAPRRFVRELARVLKPGGTLVISTPNVLNVTSRWRFFTRGFHKHFTPNAQAQFSSGHIHAIDYVLLRQFLEGAGLQIRRVATNQRLHRWRDRLFARLIRRWSRAHPFAEVLLSEELLYGQILIVVAERPSA